MIPNNPASHWEATFSIAIRGSDGTNSPTGSIALALNTEESAGTNYTVGSANRATITVNDIDYPKISIKERSLTVFATGDAELTLVSDIQPAGPLDIAYRIDNVGGARFFNTINASLTYEEKVATGLSFSTSSPYTATLSIPTVDDPFLTTGTFTVSILDDPATNRSYSYTDVVAERTATVTANDAPIPELTIANATAVEGGDNAEFTITSNIEPPFKTIEIGYIPDETNDNFLDETAGDAGE